MAWPKGRPRGPRKDIPESRDPVKSPRHSRWTMKAGNRWETGMQDDSVGNDRYHIPNEMIPEGMDLQWVTDTVYGYQETQHRNSFEKKGWTPVHPSDFDGRFQGMFNANGDDSEINLGGQVLMARPLPLSIKSRKKELEEARMRVALKEHALRGGDMPVSGADHPSALKSNKINKTWERVEIPRDDE